MPDNSPVKSSDADVHYKLKELSFMAGNFTIHVLATSAMISVVQSPLNSMMMNLIKRGSVLDQPFGLVGIMALYRGFVSGFSSGIIRSGYVTAAKKNLASEVSVDLARGEALILEGQHRESKALEGLQRDANVLEGAIRESIVADARQHSAAETSPIEKNKIEKAQQEKISIGDEKLPVTFTHKLYGIAGITAGDVALTHYPDTLTQLSKAGISSATYQWRNRANLASIAKLGIAARYSASMINFTGLCLATEFYAKYIPGSNENIKQTVGGIASGTTAALLSFPFTLYRDYAISKVSLSHDARLIVPSTATVIKQSIEEFKKMERAQWPRFYRDMAIQFGLRAAKTSVTFGIVAGVSSALGSDPLNRMLQSGDSNQDQASKTMKNKYNELKTNNPIQDQDDAPSSKMKR